MVVEQLDGWTAPQVPNPGDYQRSSCSPLLFIQEMRGTLRSTFNVKLLVVSVNAIRVLLPPLALQVLLDPGPLCNGLVQPKDLGMLSLALQLRHGLGEHELDAIHTLRAVTCQKGLTGFQMP